jgi:hypothetical protein
MSPSQNVRKHLDIEVANRSFKNVVQFKYGNGSNKPNPDSRRNSEEIEFR